MSHTLSKQDLTEYTSMSDFILKVPQSLPMSSLFLGSRARFLSAVAEAHTTRSASSFSNSTRIGMAFSLRTWVLMSADGCNTKSKGVLHQFNSQDYTKAKYRTNC